MAGLGLYLVFGLLDLTVGGRLTSYLLLIRFGAVCPTLLAVFGLSFLRDFFRIGQAGLSVAVLATGFGVVVMTAIMDPPFNSLYYAGIIMVVIFGGSMIRLKFRYSTAIALFLVGSYQVSAIWINPIPRSMLISNNFFLSMATAVGLFSGYFQELYIRRAYAGQKVVEEARLAADAANEAKSAFLATMSHEIRTPLNGVLGMVQAMAREPLPEHQRERLGVIGASGEMLLAILNDMLDLSKIEAGRLELEVVDFDLAALVSEVAAIFEPLAAGKGVAFTVEIAPDATGAYRGDPLRVRQIVHNLVSNAVKFTADGTVQVELGAEGGGVRLVVSDTGIGIAPERIEQLFDKFVQADSSTTRRYGGAGLGLAICRQLCLQMGGEIRAQSDLGRGSRFTVWLPLDAVEAAAQPLLEADEAALPGQGASLRILAAEDNPVNQLVLKTLLGQAGIEPVLVDDGAAAVAAWSGGSWDLILMDAQMPVMDGLAAAREIRRREAESGRAPTPIIALTANAMSHQVEAYLAAGMDSVVAKPIQIAELFEVIAAIAGGGEAGDSKSEKLAV
ncbi:ATP-binding protein [Phenylobacterium montanum]|uniref:Sensory/regulatory protein RpfC n=1 Tax=Phenylobacterium montanum TaxID=2823693 RepID=A0A975FZR3_9CAUL|nr:ATP-binding protein [Caulobacter sp. S6]QUD88445.1 response regulator [Caulobacter sp. S6]